MPAPKPNASKRDPSLSREALAHIFGAPDAAQLFQPSSKAMLTNSSPATLIDHVPGIMFNQSPDFSFSFITPQIEKWTGVKLADWSAEPEKFWTVVHEDDVQRLKELFKKEAASAKGLTTEYRLRHAQSGQITYVWEYRRAVRAENSFLGFQGIAWDITRQTIAEQRLASVSSRENLGVLSMGLAHDFCNLMAGIVNMAQVFELESEPEGPFAKGLKTIRETAMQASQLAKRIGKLHQVKHGDKNYEDLNEVVKGLVDLLHKAVPSKIKLSTSLEEGSLPMHVDVIELQQVIVNLVLNGADAIRGAGKIIISTRKYAELPTTISNIHGKLPSVPATCLSVRDTGLGVPADLQTAIFEPFFTTKPDGSGLGLYNARLFAEKHSAAISMESEEGKGTTFHLWFPTPDLSD